MFISITPSAFISECVHGANQQIKKYNKIYDSFIENVTVSISMKNLTAHCTCKEIKRQHFSA